MDAYNTVNRSENIAMMFGNEMKKNTSIHRVWCSFHERKLNFDFFDEGRESVRYQKRMGPSDQSNLRPPFEDVSLSDECEDESNEGNGPKNGYNVRGVSVVQFPSLTISRRDYRLASSKGLEKYF